MDDGSGNQPAAFSRFLRQYRAEILTRWENEVRALPPASKLPRPALIDHLPILLDKIANAADSKPEHGQAGSEDAADRHALARLAEGFDLSEVVTEYSLLRRIIHQMWLQEPGVEPNELEIFNRVLDNAIGEAATRYARASQRALQAVDRMSELALGSASTDDLLMTLLGVIRETCSAVDEVTILLEEGDRLFVRDAVGITKERETNFSLRVGEGFAGTIAKTGKPLFLHNASTDPLVKSQFLRDRGIKAIYGVPLLEGHVFGVAHMGSTTAYDFSEEDMLLFRTMVNRATALLIEARLKEELRLQAERQSLILSIAGIGIWDWDLRENKIHVDAQMRKLWGLPEGSDFPAETVFEAIVPHDRDRVRAETKRAAEAGTDFRSTFLIHRLDNGEEIHVRSRAGLLREANGLHMMGASVDRTDEHWLERERELYLATLGHDLRNPLNAVAMGSETLIHRDDLPARATKIVSRIATSAGQMQRMIDQLLAFARARAGQPMAMKSRAIDLVGLAKELIDQMEITAPDRKITLHADGVTVLDCDPDRIAEVLQNLVWNADKHGDAMQPIELDIHGSDDAVDLQVRNWGPPIAEELLPVLFDPFRRGGSREGLGLGLYIVKHIVDAHGGKVTVTSSEADGTRFRVHLPRLDARPRAGTRTPRRPRPSA